VARLEIPAINLKQIVVMGTTEEALAKGPGMFRTAEWPGEVGNTTIAAHRTSHGAPFKRIDELKQGDVISLTTEDGVFKYSVSETFIVQKSDTSPLKDTPGKQVLTLVSCHPLHSTAKRIIVRATLLP
jgi:sortase A